MTTGLTMGAMQGRARAMVGAMVTGATMAIDEGSTRAVYDVTVRATAVGRGAEQDAERNAVLAGDPKGLVYYVMID